MTSGPETDGSGLLRVVLGLTGALVLAVVAAHPRLRSVEKRLGLTVLASSGLVFLLLGFVFRLDAVHVLSDAVLADMQPILEFGLGWLGFTVGMQFDARDLDALPKGTGAVIFTQSAIPFAFTALACFGALLGLTAGPLGIWENRDVAFRDALALGASAAPAAPVAAVAIARSSGSLAARLIARVTVLNDVTGIVVLAIACAFFRPMDATGAWKLPGIAWALVTVGLGGVLGLATYALLRSARSASEGTALLLGSVALSSGMAGYLSISPLVLCCLAGAVLTNLPYDGVETLRSTLRDLERPLYCIFLLIAGAAWDPSAWQGWALVPIFLLARGGGKIIGARVAKHVGPEALPDARTLALALMPQSPISLATMVSFTLIYRGAGAQSQTIPWLMTACASAAFVTEIIVQVLVRLRGGLRFDLPSLAGDLGDVSQSIRLHHVEGIERAHEHAREQDGER